MHHFKATPPDFLLKTEQVDIWHYALSPEEQKDDTVLSHHEVTRANRFHFPHHKRRFIAAHTHLRHVLAHYLNQTAASIVFTSNQYGKPEVINKLNLQFNISHSRDLIVIAVGQNNPVGIDIEYFSPRPYHGIANNLFSTQEINAYKQAPHALKMLTFFSIWSQKEAFIKACGMGLSYPTKTFTVQPLLSYQQQINDPRHQKMWSMHTFMPDIFCCGALCHSPSIKNIRYISEN